jgi:phosphate-selective porin OprO and OprP
VIATGNPTSIVRMSSRLLERLFDLQRARATRIAAAGSAALLLGASAPQANAQVTFTFDKRPSLEVHDVLTADLRVKSQSDFRDFPEEPGQVDKDLFDQHRARVGVEGRFLKRFDYQVERELRDTSRPWRDVYLNARVLRGLQVRGGKFKIPFGLDQLTGSMDLDFNYRSLAGSFLSPGRDVGVMAHGRLIHDIVRYQAGVFKSGGDNVSASERTDPQTRRTYAGRLVFTPWDGSKAHKALRSMAAGIAYTTGELPEGRNSLRGKTVPGDAFFDPLYVNGRRQRMGVEFQWRPASLGLQGEYIQTRDQRIRQGMEDENLPDALAHGWYVSGTWLLTGERKTDSVEPSRPLFHGGIGAVEIAGRVEQLRSSSDGANGAFTTPRSPLIAPRTDNVWTAGVNWYLNEYVKVQANLIREQRPSSGQPAGALDYFWSRTVRLQFGL